jgi:hypothetical protein
MNNSITSGLKGSELSLNVDNLSVADLPVLKVLLKACSFTSINLTGNTEFDA